MSIKEEAEHDFINTSISVDYQEKNNNSCSSLHKKWDIIMQWNFANFVTLIQEASEMTEVMKDICSSTFCVPLICKHSPLAYSIVNEIHWHSPAAKHSGIETV